MKKLCEHKYREIYKEMVLTVGELSPVGLRIGKMD